MNIEKKLDLINNSLNKAIKKLNKKHGLNLEITMLGWHQYHSVKSLKVDYEVDINE